jgi:UDP-3-O-[3-hydroxymyristoyl] glucosamine N-acyltransferase
MNITLKKIAQIIEGELIGDEYLEIANISPLLQASPGDLSFIANAKFIKKIGNSRASALIVSRNLEVNFPNMIKVEDASNAVSALINFLEKPAQKIVSGIHQSAILGRNVQIHHSVTIGPNVIISDEVRIGDGSVIEAFCFIAENSFVGQNTRLFPRVTVYAGSVIGDGVRIHSGAVIGADGFGYDNGQKVPHLGHVRIGNNVEIGANTCIDRARLGATVIGNNTKIDNLVQIGHGTVIGDDCLICGCTGIAGSVTIGDRVTIGGAANIADHVAIPSDTILAGATTVQRDIHEPGFYSGIGPLPHAYQKRCQIIFSKLPQIYQDFYKLVKNDISTNS